MSVPGGTLTNNKPTCCTQLKSLLEEGVLLMMRSVFIKIIEIAKPEKRTGLLMCSCSLIPCSCSSQYVMLGNGPCRVFLMWEFSRKPCTMGFFQSADIIVTEWPFIISLLSWVMKFHPPTEGTNATDQRETRVGVWERRGAGIWIWDSGRRHRSWEKRMHGGRRNQSLCHLKLFPCSPVQY